MSRRPRIAFVTYAMHCGGMETVLLRLGRYLQQQGCPVEVLTTVEPGEWFGRWSELHIPAQHVSPPPENSLLAPLRHGRRVISKLIEGNFDVVFLHHSVHAQAAMARLPDNVIVIPVLHNDEESIYQVGCGNSDAWNVVVAVSPRVAATARQRVPGRPVIEISSGVELPTTSALKRRQSLGRRLELIFVGRIEHGQKGVLWLPDILKACREQGIDAGLTIIGHGPDEARLRQTLADYGVAKEVQHLKGLTPAQVYTRLLDAHILLMPSRYEGLPIALLESQACGCVPVASWLRGITDRVVIQGETGMLVEPASAPAFIDAIGTLYHDPALWTRMSDAGRARIEAHFSVQTMGENYLRLIDDAMNGGYPLPRKRRYQPVAALRSIPLREFLPPWLRRLGRTGRGWLSLDPAMVRWRRDGV